jgi:hypothetical protein
VSLVQPERENPPIRRHIRHVNTAGTQIVRRCGARAVAPELFVLVLLACGSFALAWMFLRTALVLRTLRKPSVA